MSAGFSCGRVGRQRNASQVQHVTTVALCLNDALDACHNRINLRVRFGSVFIEMMNTWNPVLRMKHEAHLALITDAGNIDWCPNSLYAPSWISGVAQLVRNPTDLRHLNSLIPSPQAISASSCWALLLDLEYSFSNKLSWLVGLVHGRIPSEVLQRISQHTRYSVMRIGISAPHRRLSFYAAPRPQGSAVDVQFIWKMLPHHLFESALLQLNSKVRRPAISCRFCWCSAASPALMLSYHSEQSCDAR